MPEVLEPACVAYFSLMISSSGLWLPVGWTTDNCLAVIVDSQQHLITFCIDLTDQHGIGEGAGKAWSPQTAERSTRKMNYDELEKLRERLVQASQHRPRSKVQEILDRLLGRVDAKLKLKPQPKSISEKDDRGKAA
jgi:hypothetical protein